MSNLVAPSFPVTYFFLYVVSVSRELDEENLKEEEEDMEREVIKRTSTILDEMGYKKEDYIIDWELIDEITLAQRKLSSKTTGENIAKILDDMYFKVSIEDASTLTNHGHLPSVRIESEAIPVMSGYVLRESIDLTPTIWVDPSLIKTNPYRKMQIIDKIEEIYTSLKEEDINSFTVEDFQKILPNTLKFENWNQLALWSIL